jgi:hypothetical protein
VLLIFITNSTGPPTGYACCSVVTLTVMSESAQGAPDTDVEGDALALGAALVSVGSGVGLADDDAGAADPPEVMSHQTSPRTTRIPMMTMIRRRQ